MKNFFRFLLLFGVFFTRIGVAQPVQHAHPDSLVLKSLSSLLSSMEQLQVERNLLQDQIFQLDEHIRGFDRLLDRHIDYTVQQQNALDLKLDTLRSLIPSEEPIRTANTNIIYLNRRQDSMMAYIGRLEDKISDLPNKHYWGVRNDFKEFDHLLLFTFLGAMMSLGIVLLVKTGKQQSVDLQGHPDSGTSSQDNDADRMSIAITLLVGSILVVLFVLFIL